MRVAGRMFIVYIGEPFGARGIAAVHRVEEHRLQPGCDGAAPAIADRAMVEFVVGEHGKAPVVLSNDAQTTTIR